MSSSFERALLSALSRRESGRLNGERASRPSRASLAGDANGFPGSGRARARKTMARRNNKKGGPFTGALRHRKRRETPSARRGNSAKVSGAGGDFSHCYDRGRRYLERRIAFSTVKKATRSVGRERESSANDLCARPVDCDSASSGERKSEGAALAFRAGAPTRLARFA